MSQKEVKKIVFCSLEEYKVMEKEVNSEYIIDAADLTEAISNPAEPQVEHDFIKLPEFYIEYKIENLPEEVHFEYVSNMFSQELKFPSGLNNKEFILDNSYFDFDNVRYNSVHIPTPVSIEPKLSGHNLVIPIKEGKLPFVLSQGKKISFSYNKADDTQLDDFDVFSEEERLDPAPKFIIYDNEFVTNYFVTKRDPHNSYTDESLHEDKKEAFEAYKQKQLEHFKNSVKKVKLSLDNLEYSFKNGPGSYFPPVYNPEGSSPESTSNDVPYVDPFKGIPFNKRDEVKVRFHKIFSTK